jgi:acyl-CoA reductase-like NAD-dependent aldehyde dehydrogenase
MPQFDEKAIENIVRTVVSRLTQEQGNAVFNDVDSAVTAAKAAQKIWVQTSKELKGRIIGALRQAMHSHTDEFARMALEETGLGRFEDKVAKHHNAAANTPGLEDLQSSSWSGDKGMVYEDWAPYGVIGAITPSTHPIPVLFNSMIIMIAPGNSVVFNVHPAAKKVSAYAVEIFNKVIIDNGGPANLITLIKEPTMESADRMFHHPDVAMIAATGGPAIVEAAFSSGKKVIAAGPGNPPVLVDETADLDLAARRIIEGATFDNNILCIAEKEVFVVEKVYQPFLTALERAGAVKLQYEQIQTLADRVFLSDKKGGLLVNREFIGKNARVLGAAVGLTLSDDIRLLFGEAQDFSCKFIQEEQMMPYLPVLKVRDVDEGIRLSVEAEHGFGHTAMIYSNNLDNITRFTKAVDTDIVVVNGPSVAGNGGDAGEGYFSHTIASPTGEGICTPRDFARIRRISFSGSLQIV